MLTAASCSASGLCTMDLDLALHIYIYEEWLLCKGVYRYICIYWAFQQCIWPVYIYLVCLFVSFYIYYLLHM